MGLFTSKKVQIFSQSFPLVMEESFAKNDAVLYAIMENRSISEMLVHSMSQGMQYKVPTMRKYAENTYPLGLPNTAVHNVNKVPTAILETLVTTEHSLPYGCVIANSFLTILDAATIVLPFLISQRNYSLRNNVVGTIPDGWIFPETYNGHLVKTVVKVYDINIANDSLSINITYKVKTRYYYNEQDIIDGYDHWVSQPLPASEYIATYTENYIIPAGYILNILYYIVGYYRVDSVGGVSETMDWWFYAMNTGKYPVMDLASAVVDEVSSYPVVPLRHDKLWISDSDPALYASGKELLSKISVNYDDLVTQLDANPDIADIDCAYILFGIDLQTDDIILIGYLVDFFNMLSQTGDATIWDQIVSFNNSGDIAATGSYTYNDYSQLAYSSTSYVNDVFDSLKTTNLNITSADAVTCINELGLRTQITWDRISSVILSGSIGEIGHATKEIVLTTTTDYYEQMVEPSQLILKRQIRINAYQQIIITRPRHFTYGVYRDHKIIQTDLRSLSEDEDDHTFIIPLHHPTVMNVKNIQRNYVYQNSLNMVITGYIVTHLKWYQQGWFQVVVMVIALALTYFTVGKSMVAMKAWIAGIAPAINAGTMALVLHVLTPILKLVLLDMAAKALIKIIGIELSMIISFIIFVYTGYMSKEFAVALSPTVAKFSAENLLKFSMKLASEATTALKTEFKEIQEESEEFTEESQILWEELYEKQDSILPNYLLPFSLLDNPFSSNQTEKMSDPEELYSRTHVGNIGTLSLDVIENYVDINLLLPEKIILT